MPLTDADRMQMTLMAVMRHNVVTITEVGPGPEPGGGGYFGEIEAMLISEPEVVEPVIYTPQITVSVSEMPTVVTIAGTWTYNEYLLL
ncbi:hypothetical protein SDC9_162279 [bioreactor metagenome]|uniref:Uncharacterized protein n=1 Tax=bioreactor metagenome TaxID=1076179 RepID=A0A645FLY5_9ZZZZ